jgi:hypothetical protein
MFQHRTHFRKIPENFFAVVDESREQCRSRLLRRGISKQSGSFLVAKSKCGGQPGMS